MFAFLFPPRRSRPRALRGATALCAAASGVLVALGACTADPRPVGATWRDDYGDSIVVGRPAGRIVSLNPTTTEILFALGAGDRLVGRSHWDTWPPAAGSVPDLGDALRPNVERVLGARPGLVVLYAGGDNRDAAGALKAAGLRVVALRVNRIAEFDRAVRLLGSLTGTGGAAAAIVDSVRGTLDRVRAATRGIPRPGVVVHVWDNPLMVIGGGSFMSELIDIAGGRNVYADLEPPSAQVAFEDLVRRDPDVVLAGPETVARLRSDARWRALRAVREGRVLTFDTSLVARPSVQLGEAAWSLARLLHPGIDR